MEINFAQVGDQMDSNYDSITLHQIHAHDRCSSAPRVLKNAVCFNVNAKSIQKAESETKRHFVCNYLSQHLETPGFSRLFPSRMTDFVSSSNYIFHEESQNALYPIAQGLYELEHAVRKEKKLSKIFNERYIQFEMPTFKMIKFIGLKLKEDGYLRKIQDERKRPNHILSSQGIGMTYRFWNCGIALVRCMFDTH